MLDLDDAVLAARAPMLADIRRQAGTLGALLRRRDEIAAFGARALAPGPGGRLWVVGSGDGWFAARAVASAGGFAAASSLGFLLDVAPGLTSADRVLAISMSGSVDRTVEAAQAALAAGAGAAVLTNGDGGRLGALGLTRFSLDLPDIAPFLCGTATYTATLAALAMLTEPPEGGFTAALGDVLGDVPDLVRRADALAADMVAAGGPPPGIRFLGAGASVATADYGAAKCVEVTATPAWGDDLEEFAHRQFWRLGRGELVVLLPVDSRSAAYVDASAEALALLPTPTLALEPEGAPAPAARFRLPLPGGRAVAAITQAIAIQLVAYRIGVAAGLDPNRRLHLKSDGERFAVSRRLTRRSLLGSGL